MQLGLVYAATPQQGIVPSISVVLITKSRPSNMLLVRLRLSQARGLQTGEKGGECLSKGIAIFFEFTKVQCMGEGKVCLVEQNIASTGRSPVLPYLGRQFIEV